MDARLCLCYGVSVLARVGTRRMKMETTDGSLVGKRVRITYPLARGESGVFEGIVTVISTDRVAIRDVVLIPPRGTQTLAADQSFWRADVRVEEIDSI